MRPHSTTMDPRTHLLGRLEGEVPLLVVSLDELDDLRQEGGRVPNGDVPSCEGSRSSNVLGRGREELDSFCERLDVDSKVTVARISGER